MVADCPIGPLNQRRGPRRWTATPGVLDSLWTPRGVHPVNSPRAGRQQGSMGSVGCAGRSEEHTSELQSRRDLVCRLLLEKKKKRKTKRKTNQGTESKASRRTR